MNEPVVTDEIPLTLPLRDSEVKELTLGQSIRLSGTLITARDEAHKWLVETFIRPASQPSPKDLDILAQLRSLLMGGAIYHCGPVVEKKAEGGYRILAAGPTTSAREEPYEAEVMQFLNLKAVIGKGGMGLRTLEACQQTPAVYLHAVGGAAALIAQSVTRVVDVFKLEFGVPEALWVLEVRDFPAVVTMDAKGNSLHEQVRAVSQIELQRLMARNQ